MRLGVVAVGTFDPFAFFLGLTLLSFGATRTYAASKSLLHSARKERQVYQLVHEAQKKTEYLFLSVLAASEKACALVTPEGYFVAANKPFSELCGWPVKNLVGRTWMSITHPDDLEKDAEYVREMVAGDLTFYELHKRYLAEDGRPMPVLLRVCLLRNVDGTPDKFFVTIEKG